MSAIANIAILDGESSPISHVFNPKSIIGDVASYENRVNGQPVGFEKLLIGLQSPSKNSHLYKTRIRGHFPVMEVVNASTWSGITPAATKAFEHGFDLTFFSPDRGTEQQRKNARVLLMSLLNITQVVNVLDKLENIY